MPFKPEVKAKLVEALRSGEYKKDEVVRCVLRTTSDCYCVMGVAADLVAPEKWDALPGTYARKFEGMLSSVGDEVLGRLGISRIEEWRLNSLNDGGKSFTELADIIERKF